MTLPRVRFAPSPTGYLHVGGARTALFNWLYARKTGGVFILRIEDTDKARSTEAHTCVILDGLRWLGLDWNEGPYFQGEFGEGHRANALRLLEAGAAYRCFCTPEELEAQRRVAGAGGAAFRYDRRCDRLPADEVRRRVDEVVPWTIRFRMPETEIAWEDAVHGRIAFHGRDLDDFIVLRADGSAVYNMAVVSDDIAMRVTHVIRGDDHVSNTPKQLVLYQALGAPLPVFAHVPMILGGDGKKLSKRHGATAIGDYQDLGILPEAMRNFLALLGWSPGDDVEILPEEEMIRRFSLEGIQKKAAVFDTAKLEWMNGQYLSSLSAAALEAPVRRQLERLGVDLGDRPLAPLIDAVKTRSRTVVQLAEQIAVRVDASRATLDPKADALIGKMGSAYPSSLDHALEVLQTVPDGEWTPDGLIDRLKARAEQAGLKLGDLLQPIRVALTGATVSEPVNELLAVVGREESLARLAEARRRHAV